MACTPRESDLKKTGPAAQGTADYINRGRSVTHLDNNKTDEVSQSKTIGSIRASRRPKLAPDKKPPKLHRMGKYTWTRQTRKLDALFAIYVMGWETKDNGCTKWRYWIKPTDTGGWESEMLPYFHDDTRACYYGVERLRKDGIFLTVETKADGYEVVEKTKKIAVRDRDLNFAIMAVSLLIKGVSNKEIQYAWDNQNDWSKRAAKRYIENA